MRSGAYPRRSLLEYTPDYKTVIGIGKTGERFIDLIETEIKRDRKRKHVIITVNAIVGSEAIRSAKESPKPFKRAFLSLYGRA